MIHGLEVAQSNDTSLLAFSKEEVGDGKAVGTAVAQRHRVAAAW